MTPAFVYACALAFAPPAEPTVDTSTPDVAVSQDPASEGSTDLGTDTFATAAKRDEADATELEIAGGSLLSTGNARAFQATALGRFRVRRQRHQFATAVAANYGRAAPDPDTNVQTTVSNIQGLLRYDYFFARRWSAFAMAQGRRDRFQGLDLRLNIDPGFAFYALTNPKHRLWFEAGYDFQYDRHRRDSIFADVPVDPDNPDGETMRVQVAPPVLLNHAVRLYTGYSNQLSDLVSLDTGLELLQSVLVARRFRINWISSVTANINNRIGVATTFTLRYENLPLPGVAKLDTITAVLLNLKFL